MYENYICYTLKKFGLAKLCKKKFMQNYAQYFTMTYRKLVTITLGTMSKFGFIPYGTNTIETIAKPTKTLSP
ncbi:hypothetical protein BpHYR1_016835 [Brachionus plicatilis]|uniref:Uncharacterized protein n=1 Tax=Brachionus plicatilis TaxID=10195 RepID=A0A3M7PF20_BRAPC|nr:hypothetical protein BpHYR1_016835 [Brachionus plicatilis]